MAASRTRTIKNKHAVPKQKPENDKKGSSSARVSKPRRPSAAPPSKQVHKSSVSEAKKPKKKTWTSEELGVPKLNMVTPLGVTKPPGKKKGKVFVDDRVRFLFWHLPFPSYVGHSCLVPELQSADSPPRRA